jgi:hypothetical protein
MKRFFVGSLSFLGLSLLAAMGPVTAQAAPQRIAMSNGLVFPYTNQVSAGNVRHYQKLRVVPTSGKATYSNIQLTYANFEAINGGESTSFQPVTIQAEILYNGTYYPVTFNGQRSATISGGGYVTGSVAGLSLLSGAEFYERVRLVGAPGSQKYLVSHGARRALLEGALATTDTNVNFLGGKEGHGATCSFVIQSGKITSGTIKTQGSNYTSAGTVVAFDPTTQAETAVGYASQSGGKMSSIVLTSGGSNISSGTKCLITGGGGFGINAAIYAASLITGIPSVDGLTSLLIVGDSIARGYGSTDSLGDAAGNYGIFERAVENRYATVSTALPGNTATAYKNLSSHARMYQIILPYVTHAMINLGTNDIAMGYSASSITGANTAIAAELRKAGIKVSFVTLLPRDSGTFTTLSGQTPVTGFGSNGYADTYNTWLRGGTNGLTSDWGVIEARTVYQDGSDKDKWRVNAVMTNDGIHPNVNVGIPFGASQLAARFGSLAPASQGAAAPASPAPPSDTDLTSYASNTTINLDSGITSITMYGTGDTLNGGWASYTLSATGGGNTFNTGSAQATLNIGGVNNHINIGVANTWINDSGTYNTIKLSEAGQGVAVISGNIFSRGTKLDLRTLINSTSWNGDSKTLGNYLKIWISGTTGVLLVTPTGNSNGTTYVAAKLTSYGSLTLPTLLTYSVLQ